MTSKNVHNILGNGWFRGVNNYRCVLGRQFCNSSVVLTARTDAFLFVSRGFVFLVSACITAIAWSAAIEMFPSSSARLYKML